MATKKKVAKKPKKKLIVIRGNIVPNAIGKLKIDLHQPMTKKELDAWALGVANLLAKQAWDWAGSES